MRLISFTLSPFSAKVRIALAEKQLACEISDVPTTRAGIASKPAELLAINPRGQVPVLIDGELAIYDSTAIVEYLEDRAPERPLYPKDPVARARCLCRAGEPPEPDARRTRLALRGPERRRHRLLRAFLARNPARCHGAGGARPLPRLARAHGATPERSGRRAAHARRRGAHRSAR